MHTWFFNICTFFNHHIPTIFPNNCSWALPTAFFISHFKSIGPQFLSSWRHPIQTSLPKHKSIHWRFRYLSWIFANSLGSQIHEVVIAYMAQQKMLQSTLHIYIYIYKISKTLLMYSTLWIVVVILWSTLCLSLSLESGCKSQKHADSEHHLPVHVWLYVQLSCALYVYSKWTQKWSVMPRALQLSHKHTQDHMYKHAWYLRVPLLLIFDWALLVCCLASLTQTVAIDWP